MVQLNLLLLVYLNAGKVRHRSRGEKVTIVAYLPIMKVMVVVLISPQGTVCVRDLVKEK